MLISSDTELRKFLPSSVIKDVKTIAMLIERAEDAHLRPVLGDTLYTHILQLHDEGVTEDTKANQLITLCQSAALYFAMADNVGILSISYNTGGGFSVVTTDGYSPADEKEKDRLERDLWKNAWRDIDRILDLLEADAKSETPSYAEMWRESEWFYFQGDLLLTTAKETKRYVTGEEAKTFDRKRFVEIQGDLRFCQMSFISKSIGDDFLEWLVQYDYTKQQTAPSIEGESNSPIPNDKVVRKTKELLSMALMAAMRYRRDHRGADENDANLALFRATEYIKQHQDDYGDIIKTSHLYTPPKTEDEHHHGHRKHQRVASCQCLEGGEALFVPFM